MEETDYWPSNTQEEAQQWCQSLLTVKAAHVKDIKKKQKKKPFSQMFDLYVGMVSE